MFAKIAWSIALQETSEPHEMTHSIEMWSEFCPIDIIEFQMHYSYVFSVIPPNAVEPFCFVHVQETSFSIEKL